MRPSSLRSTLLFAVLAAGCGASGAPSERAEPPPEPAPEALAEAPDEAGEATTEPPSAPEEPPPAPEPEAVVVEAGRRLGPITLGMSEAELGELGREVAAVDSRSRQLGPYRVFLDDGAVTRVDAFLGALERIRIGDDVYEAGVHIHRLRDGIGTCRWQEGGGERYRCADGGLWVHTTHSLDPARYTVSVRTP